MTPGGQAETTRRRAGRAARFRRPPRIGKSSGRRRRNLDGSPTAHPARRDRREALAAVSAGRTTQSRRAAPQATVIRHGRAAMAGRGRRRSHRAEEGAGAMPSIGRAARAIKAPPPIVQPAVASRREALAGASGRTGRATQKAEMELRPNRRQPSTTFAGGWEDRRIRETLKCSRIALCSTMPRTARRR